MQTNWKIEPCFKPAEANSHHITTTAAEPSPSPPQPEPTVVSPQSQSPLIATVATASQPSPTSLHHASTVSSSHDPHLIPETQPQMHNDTNPPGPFLQPPCQ